MKILKNVNRYRLIVAISFVIATALVLAFPVKMFGASPWAYYYGVQNFAEGNLVVDDAVHTAQVNDARQQGGTLQQYMDIGDNQWALEKAPGYVFYLVPFQWLGIPRWGNIVLALGMIIVTYLMLKRMRDEKTACIGSLLMLFTPVTLIMCNLVYMDTFASLAFIAMGGGLYIYHHLERGKLSTTRSGVLLFLSFLLIAWSVVVRYTNFPVAAVFVLHFVIVRLMSFRREVKKKLCLEIGAVALGAGLPLAVFLIYNYIVFGSPFDYGYHYSTMPIEFAFQYLGQVDKNGQSVPLQIILDNLKSAPKPLLWGFPLLVAGIPAFGVVLYQKFRRHEKTAVMNGRWSSLRSELPWDILLVLIGWFTCVFFLYLTYEFTSEGNLSFIRFARFYLPGLFPVAVISALVIARLPFKLWIPVLLAAIIACMIIYLQYINGNSSSFGGSRSNDNRPGIEQRQNSPRRTVITTTETTQ